MLSRINRWTILFTEHEMVNNFFIDKSELALVLATGPSIRDVIVQFMNRTVLFVASVCRSLFAGGEESPIGTKLTQRLCGSSDPLSHV